MSKPTHTSQLQPCKVPLRRIELVRNVFIVVHEGLIPALRRVRAKYEAADGYTRYPIRQRDTGAYNCRKTTSGASWSKHSYGCAIDVNWSTNPYGSHLVTDMPPWFRQIWLGEGFGWGGNWSGSKDAMHFSRFPNEGGNGKLEYEDAQEDDVSKKDVIDALNELKPTDLNKSSALYLLWAGLYEKPGGKYVEATDQVRDSIKAEIAKAKAEILAAIAGN